MPDNFDEKIERLAKAVEEFNKLPDEARKIAMDLIQTGPNTKKAEKEKECG